MIENPVDSWVTGQLALALLAVDPAGLRGLHLRARASPVRDAFLDGLPCALQPIRKITPNLSDTQLFGGVDIAATLAEARLVRSTGILAEPCRLMLSMAERCHAELAARLAQALDGAGGHSLILLDEGAEPDEHAPTTLIERLAFSLDLDGLRAAELAQIALGQTEIEAARAHLSDVVIPDDAIAMLTVTAARFGITSMRAPILALNAARAHAALGARSCLSDEDLEIAAQLVFSHRATQWPDQQDAPAEPQTEPEDDTPDPTSQDESQSLDLPEDLLVEAVKALLPPDLLGALMKTGGTRSAKGTGGAGAKRKGNRRGRPLPSRPGTPGQDSRIDIIATLRAAAPWQPMRRKAHPDAKGLLIRPTDIHVRRFQEMSDRLVIFAVDASGSSAVARLAEVKGAIELLLADAYSKRDHVALVSFRGEGASVLLPPTRSLVQTKRRLASLPGGGGTPLAAGLKTTAELARQAQSQGLSPSIAILTDGRANVPLDGRTGRAAAREDAQRMAGLLTGQGWPMAVVDTAMRPQADLARLAQQLGASYLPLPRADARRLSTAIGSALEA